MEYVIAILLLAVIYLFYLYAQLVREQNWQNRYLDILDRDLKKAEIMNEINITMENDNE